MTVPALELPFTLVVAPNPIYPVTKAFKVPATSYTKRAPHHPLLIHDTMQIRIVESVRNLTPNGYSEKYKYIYIYSIYR